MKFKLNIDCNNAAFVDNNAHLETAKILERLQRSLNRDSDQNPLFCGEYMLRDTNGNKVGTAEFVEGSQNEPATPEDIELARAVHAGDLCQIDDDALASRTEDGKGVWVQAWVRVLTDG